jgi:hypothetical protein
MDPIDIELFNGWFSATILPGNAISITLSVSRPHFPTTDHHYYFIDNLIPNLAWRTPAIESKHQNGNAKH